MTVAMRMQTAISSLCLLCIGASWPSMAQEKIFSLSVKANFTTASQLFPNPDSPDEVERAQFVSIQNFFGYSIELKYHLPESNLALGLSADYIRATTSESLGSSPSLSIPVEDGYRVIPIELTAYFFIPVSGPTFGIYMGGGGGAYLGDRIYSIGNVEAGTTQHGHGFGIHVLGGVTYRLNEWFSLSGEMKFRDLQFTTTNAFSVPRIIYSNTAVSVSQVPFDSNVHTDGIVFQLGAAVSF